MSTIKEIQDEIIEEFAVFDDWYSKFQYIIDLGQELQPLEECYKTDNNKIEGCQSTVWLHAEYVDGKVLFRADGDAIITKGIIALLIKVYSGHTPDEILDNDPYFVETIGLCDNLTPTRSNGLLAMIKQMKIYALAFKAASK